MPVRNGARYIAEAVGSVLPQLTRDDELIIVDDRSSDETRAVIFRRPDPRLRVLDGSGRGVSSARNIGLAAATGEFIAFLDHDDFWPRDRHAVLLHALSTDVTLDAAFGRIRLRFEPDAINVPHIAVLEGRTGPNSVLGNALFRRRILRLAGAFDEKMRFGEDIDYYVRLTECNYRFASCDVDALVYRRHGANVTCDGAAAIGGMMEVIRRKRVRNSRTGSKS